MSRRTLRSGKVVGETASENLGANGGVQVVVTADPEESHPGQTCQVCRVLDTVDMVQCDVCSKWHHFRCVGVTQQIEHFPWSCAKCESAEGVQEIGSTAALLQGSGGPLGQSFKSHANRLSVQSDQLQHQQRTQQQHQQSPDVAACQLAFSRAADESNQPKGEDQAPFVSSLQWVVSPSQHRSKASSESSSRSSQALAKLNLQMLEEMRDVERREAERQRAIAAEEANKEKAFLEQKYHLLEQAMSENGSSKSDSMTRTQNWIAATNTHRNRQIVAQNDIQTNSNVRAGEMQVWNPPATRISRCRSSLLEPNPPDPFPAPESMLSCPVDPPALNVGMQRLAIGSQNQIPPPMQSRPIPPPSRRVSMAQLPYSGDRGAAAPDHFKNMEADPSRRFSHNMSVPEYQRFAPHSSQSAVHQQHHPQSSTMRDNRLYEQEEEESDPYPITRRQLAARQAISKDLPTFSGDPEDWPMFLATFNSTTALCGFTNDENIARLQRSLKVEHMKRSKVGYCIHPTSLE
ncbi:uncharacterized protein LOC134286444 [Aedes albopictus]|uniref:PHD-type domain-containing protein n=1 Tax=Aedes albopictus TaxID=7160 RepID=A0ABM1YTQ0_AEDAL